MVRAKSKENYTNVKEKGADWNQKGNKRIRAEYQKGVLEGSKREPKGKQEERTEKEREKEI